jgi:hypothetical protein
MAEQFRMPDFEEIDVLKKGEGFPGTAARQASEIKESMAGQSQTPVDEFH